MFYRENGQFKTTYRADQQILPILQDRIAMLLLLVVGFAIVPMLASDYIFRAILIPFLIFSLAAIGVNILVGYFSRRITIQTCTTRYCGGSRHHHVSD